MMSEASVNTDADAHREANFRAYQLQGPLRGRGLAARLFVRALLGLSLACASGSSRTDVAPEPDTPPTLVHARLVAENTSLQRRQKGWLAVQLKMKPGWHTYWRNPGDSGLETRIKWILPEGASAGPTVWPRPERFVARSIVGYGYSAEVALLVPVSLSARFAFDRISIAASVSWLACSDVCIPGAETLKLTLPVTDATPKADATRARLFAVTRRQIPRPAPFLATFSLDQDHIRLGLPRAAFSRRGKLSMAFYPFDSSLIEHGAPQSVVRRERRIELTLRRSPVSSDQVGTLDGLLVVEESDRGNAKSRAFDVFARRAKDASESFEAR